MDNESLTEGQKGWISQFHRTLEIRLRQLLGENPNIWRDQKLSVTDIFDEKIINAFDQTKLMVSIASPPLHQQRVVQSRTEGVSRSR